jgi:hypothetical protein
MTVRHSRGLVYELKVSGEAEALGLTGTHPVWSVDRGEWVAARELAVGERLLGWEGQTPAVESVALAGRPEVVYNVQVAGDHCYRVGEQGLLVHNMSPGGGGLSGGSPPPPPWPMGYQEILIGLTGPRIRYARGSARRRGQRSGDYWQDLLRGFRNLGFAEYVNAQGNPRRIPQRDYHISMGAGQHSEDLILHDLIQLGTVGWCDCSSMFRVTVIYSERYPCPSCQSGPLPEIARCNFGQTIQLYYLGPFGGDNSFVELIRGYQALHLYGAPYVNPGDPGYPWVT